MRARLVAGLPDDEPGRHLRRSRRVRRRRPRRRQDAHLPRRLVRRHRASRASGARTTRRRSPAPERGYSNAGWTELSSSTNGTNGFLAYGYCQNGQCGYDDFVASPAGQPGVGAGHADKLWLGGSMNYDELVAYGGLPPRSNGRAVIRSTNGGAAAADVDLAGHDGDARRRAGVRGHGGHSPGRARGRRSTRPTRGSRSSARTAASCASTCGTRGTPPRRADADVRLHNGHGAVPLAPADLADCQRALSGIPTAITPLNDGLNTIQFQSLSFNPANPTGQLLGGTQDNGTFSYTGSSDLVRVDRRRRRPVRLRRRQRRRSATTTTTTPRPR